MTRLHVVGDRSVGNGMYAVAKLLAVRDGGAVMSCGEFMEQKGLADVDEVVVHGCWLPCYWKACWKVLRERKKGEVRDKKCGRAHPLLVRMTHGSMSPVYLEQQGKWKKRLAAPVERWLFSKCDRIVVTGAWEKRWCEQWGLKGPFEIVDLKHFFVLNGKFELGVGNDGGLRVLYLGRPHPLKGTGFLERAVREINEECGTRKVELRMVSNHAGEALERDWAWCDVLCLPTLSENFGLVVAEALERGKRVITTDGAPAWEGQEGVAYLRGYRDGDDVTRVKMLKEALEEVVI